jgi:hypothetical protein
MWAQHLHWFLHGRYSERHTAGTYDVSKPRLQINPETWCTTGGGKYLGANMTSSKCKPPPGAVEGEPLNANEG